MLKIRLQRIGRRNQPHFRVIVAEHTIGVKSNKYVELLGNYNPRTKETNLKKERIEYWLSVGAKATDRVHNMLVKAGIIKADTINVLPQKTPVVKEQETKEEESKQESDTGEEANTTDEEQKEEAEVESAEQEESKEDTKEDKAEE